MASPAVTQATIANTICRSGYAAEMRPTRRGGVRGEEEPAAGSRRARRLEGAYEEDHLIPLELGGAPTDERDLWPQPRRPADGWEASRKDDLEGILHREVCAGRLSPRRNALSPPTGMPLGGASCPRVLNASHGPACRADSTGMDTTHRRTGLRCTCRQWMQATSAASPPCVSMARTASRTIAGERAATMAALRVGGRRSVVILDRNLKRGRSGGGPVWAWISTARAGSPRPPRHRLIRIPSPAPARAAWPVVESAHDATMRLHGALRWRTRTTAIG